MSNIPEPVSTERSADATASFWFLGTLMRLKAAGEDTGGIFGLIEQAVPPGFAAPPHVHHAEDEAFYVLEGNFTFFREAQAIPARPGSFVWFPRDRQHWFRVEGDSPGRLLQWNIPAGLERFFVELGEPASDLTATPAEPPDFARLLALARRYGMEIGAPEA